MTEEARQSYMEIMADNLSVLRAKLNLTQSELADIVGISRYTLIAIEKKQRMMTWNTFLSLLFIFEKNDDSKKLLHVLEIYTSELEDFFVLNDVGVKRKP